MLVYAATPPPLYWKTLTMGVTPFIGCPAGLFRGSERICRFHIRFDFTLMVEDVVPQTPGSVPAIAAVPGTVMEIDEFTAADTVCEPPGALYPTPAPTVSMTAARSAPRTSLLFLSI